jgi:hypothetical protein
MERRRATRRAVVDREPLAHARLRTGGDLQVIDASSWGALVQTHDRLLPGRHLDVHVISTRGRLLVRSRVTRAFVCHLAADTVVYRAALAFDYAVDVRADGYALPSASLTSPIVTGTDYPLRPLSSEIEFAEGPSS